MSKKIHFKIDIKDALCTWSPSIFETLFLRDDGTSIPPHEAKLVLIEALLKGELFLSCGDCNDFDPRSGCRVHIIGVEK